MSDDNNYQAATAGKAMTEMGRDLVSWERLPEYRMPLALQPGWRPATLSKEAEQWAAARAEAEANYSRYHGEPAPPPAESAADQAEAAALEQSIIRKMDDNEERHRRMFARLSSPKKDDIERGRQLRNEHTLLQRDFSRVRASARAH